MIDFVDLLEQYIARSMERQYLLLEFLENAGNWSYETASGVLSFENGLEYKTQILGTESEAHGTWLWSWANPGDNLPDKILTSALELKEYGRANKVREFTESELELDEYVNGFNLALVATALCGTKAFYRGDTGGPIVYLLLEEGEFPRDERPQALQISSTFTKLISSIDIDDHPRTFLNYLRSHELTVQESGPALFQKYKITGLKNGQEVISAEFNKNKLLVNIQAEVGPVS